jgi:Uncharacterised nucleotidyltransferase
MDARHLTKALSDPSYVRSFSAQSWTALIAMARAERLDGTLAWRLRGIAVPPTVERVLAQSLANAETGRTHALWEAEMARRALAPLGIRVILLKGSAFVAAGLKAGQGRLIGDLDILVPRARLDEAEVALLAAGWEWVKDDPYDNAYYRDHMHELPPLIHRTRDRMIDVHHTILPLTSRIRPDAAALLEASVQLENGLRILSPEDMIVHAVAHLFADGDLAGGLRNLWDIDQLIREFAEEEGFWDRLLARAQVHQLPKSTARALRLTHHLYATPVRAAWAMGARRSDVFYLGRLLARDSWGRESRKLLRFAFYIRSHWIRMPPLKLARHLWVKWRRG